VKCWIYFAKPGLKSPGFFMTPLHQSESPPSRKSAAKEHKDRKEIFSVFFAFLRGKKNQ